MRLNSHHIFLAHHYHPSNPTFHHRGDWYSDTVDCWHTDIAPPSYISHVVLKIIIHVLKKKYMRSYNKSYQSTILTQYGLLKYNGLTAIV